MCAKIGLFSYVSGFVFFCFAPAAIPSPPPQATTTSITCCSIAQMLPPDCNIIMLGSSLFPNASKTIFTSGSKAPPIFLSRPQPAHHLHPSPPSPLPLLQPCVPALHQFSLLFPPSLCPSPSSRFHSTPSLISAKAALLGSIPHMILGIQRSQRFAPEARSGGSPARTRDTNLYTHCFCSLIHALAYKRVVLLS